MIELKTLVEQHIDSVGLERLMEVMSEVCHEKAEHLEDNWQDNVQAALWRNASRRLSMATDWDAVRKLTSLHGR